MADIRSSGGHSEALQALGLEQARRAQHDEPLDIDGLQIQDTGHDQRIADSSSCLDAKGENSTEVDAFRGTPAPTESLAAAAVLSMVSLETNMGLTAAPVDQAPGQSGVAVGSEGTVVWRCLILGCGTCNHVSNRSCGNCRTERSHVTQQDENPAELVANLTRRLEAAQQGLLKSSPDADACSVCGDSLNDGKRDGVRCANGHIICWMDCFGSLLHAAQDGTNVSEDGTLRCPICRDPYCLTKISQFAPTNFSDQVIALKVKMLVEKQIRAANIELGAKRQQEMKRICGLSLVDQQVYQLKNAAIDNVLFMHCPNPDCRAPFDDFDGCFVIVCPLCRVLFCAWCFHHASGKTSEIHMHVRQCPQARGQKGSYFGDKALLNQAWNELRIQKLRELTDGFSDEVKSKLLQELQWELENRGILLDKL